MTIFYLDQNIITDVLLSPNRNSIEELTDMISEMTQQLPY
jgi:hypothetical protein